MTPPRNVRPIETLMITRRTVVRMYLFRPDPQMNQIFLYCLGLASTEFGIVLHAAALMSTHYHLVVSDPWGVYPFFTKRLNRLMANATNALRKRKGEAFNGQRPGVQVLETTSAVVDKIGYTIANPVAAGAVRYARDWPGVATRISEIGRRTFVVDRPRYYFSPTGKLPERVEVRFELPAALVEEHGEAGAREHLRASVDEHERLGRAECRRKGWKFQGAKRVLRLRTDRCARAYEVSGRLHPTFATKGGGREAYIVAVQKRREFHVRYRESLKRWRDGDRDVVFPAGTWFMRVFHRVRCEPFVPSQACPG